MSNTVSFKGRITAINNESTIAKIYTDVFTKSPIESIRKLFRDQGINISVSEVKEFIELISEYESNPKMKTYNKLPKSIKGYVNKLYTINIAGKSRKRTNGITKEVCSKYFLDSFSQSAAFDLNIENFNMVTSEASYESNKEIKDIFQNSYDELFGKMDELREEDPAAADYIQSIKDAFDDALTFNRQKEYIDNDKPRNVRKYYQHYNSEVLGFNKLINANPHNIKLPNIDELLPVIKRWAGLSTDESKSVVVCLIRTYLSMDKSDIIQLGYIFKSIDNIYGLRFVNPKNNRTDATDLIVNNILDLNNYIKLKGGK